MQECKQALAPHPLPPSSASLTPTGGSGRDWGFNKTAVEFGAIATDSYSHMPSHTGTQQPGMTGLVKEELLTRSLEVAIRVENGEIRFDPLLLRQDELLDQAESWQVYDIHLEPTTIHLPEGSLGMTLCQVLVVVSTTPGDPAVEIVCSDDTTKYRPGPHLDRQTSAKIFARSGKVTQIRAYLPGEAVEGA